MAKSLIEELPRIVNEGRREAQQILERLSSGTQIGLQTNELVLPSKDVSGLFNGSSPQIPNAFNNAVGGDETDFPYKEKNHVLFSFFLLKKLLETKSSVTFELSVYITTIVKHLSIVSNRKSQTPMVICSESISADCKKKSIFTK